MGIGGGASPSSKPPPDRQGAGAGYLRSASNAAHLMLRLRNSAGSAGFRRAQNTAPSAPLAPFLGREGTPPPVFAGRMRTDRKIVAGLYGSYAHVEIFNRAWQACEPFPAVWRGFVFVGRARSRGSLQCLSLVNDQIALQPGDVCQQPLFLKRGKGVRGKGEKLFFTRKKVFPLFPESFSLF